VLIISSKLIPATRPGKSTLRNLRAARTLIERVDADAAA